MQLVVVLLIMVIITHQNYKIKCLDNFVPLNLKINIYESKLSGAPDNSGNYFQKIWKKGIFNIPKHAQNRANRMLKHLLSIVRSSVKC
jgi:predicted PurR-regulated permease PerM